MLKSNIENNIENNTQVTRIYIPKIEFCLLLKYIHKLNE